ncbi:MAG: hypothetical protein BYD32DRAFT_420579 [Podila humilis]|nr:MAG: hypothetical protein BYD32DRAFT_420579 [Podila humilis]
MLLTIMLWTCLCLAYLPSLLFQLHSSIPSSLCVSLAHRNVSKVGAPFYSTVSNTRSGFPLWRFHISATTE